MNVLYGLYQPDEGEILIDGEPVHFAGPGDAIAAGIGMVHQHFMLIPVFTVAENVVLGHEEPRGRVPGPAARPRPGGRGVRSATASTFRRTPWWATCRWASSSAWRSSRR